MKATAVKTVKIISVCNKLCQTRRLLLFTGTPLLKDDKTENKFGKIIHSYTMQQAVEHNMVTPLLYEECIPELNVNYAAIDAWFNRMTDKLSDKQKTDLKRKFSQKGQIYQTEGRIELIAHDIADHFQNFKQQGLKVSWLVIAKPRRCVINRRWIK